MINDYGIDFVINFAINYISQKLNYNIATISFMSTQYAEANF